MSTPLITVDDLRALVGDRDLVVIDARHDLADPDAGRAAFELGHIPGARHVHLDDDLSGPREARVSAAGHSHDGGRHPLPDPEHLRACLEGWGVSDRTRLVAVDAQGGIFAARLWWLARWLGHENVSVLDGGLQAWQSQGLPLEQGPGQPATPSTLTRRIALTRLVGIDDVVASLDERTLALVDARAPDRFRGENETLDPVGGHIPGAANRFFRDNLATDGRFKPSSQLAQEWSAVVSDPSRTALYCGSGVTACHDLLALEIAGLPGAALYGGSWSDWVSSSSRPVATGG